MRVIFALMRRLLALTLLLVLVPATRAAAADYYVTDGGSGAQCTRDAPCTLSSALFIADGTPDELDRIHVVGQLLWPSPVNLENSPIELIGSGTGSQGTFIDVTSDTAVAVGAGSTVRDAKARSDDHPAFELTSGATLTGIAAQTDMPAALSS